MSPTDIDPNEDQESQESAEATEKPRLSLEVKVDKPGACQRHITVTVSRADVDRYLSKAFDELKTKAEVPGFRPGRAPRKLVESRFKEQVGNQVKGSILMDSLSQVSEDYEFSAISEPNFDIEAVTLPDDGPFTFEFDVEVRPEFDVPVWGGLKLERPVRTFSDEDVRTHMNRLLTRHGKMIDREGGAHGGDTLDVEVKVSHDGKVLVEHSGVRVRLVPKISFRDVTVGGFDALLAGATVGETRTTTATISDGAENESMRGKEVSVSFQVTAVRYTELPVLTQAFLGEIGGFEDEDELLEAVRGELERQAAYSQQRRLREQITAALIKGATWDLPPDLVRRQARRELERMVLELQSSGFTGDTIRQYANQIRQNSLRATEAALKEHFIFERIAEDRKIEAEPGDYDKEIELIADQSDDTARRVRARIEKRGQMDALRNQIIERKVVELICSEAQFTDVPVQDEPDDVSAVDLALAGGHDSTEIPEAKHGGEAEELREPVDRF
jgi:trigger factor